MCKNSFHKIQNILGPLSGKNVRVAMIDSGWDNTINFKNVEQGVSFINDMNKQSYSYDDQDRIGHGTSCIDIFQRISPDARITPVRIFGKEKKSSVQILINALKWTIKKKFDLINISLGTNNKDAIVPLYRICEQAKKENIIIVAAMHHGELQDFPAQFDNVISIGGIKSESLFNYFNGPGNAIEYLAKCNYNNVLTVGNKYVNKSGVSYATAIVSGYIALFLQYNKNISIDEVHKLLSRYSKDLN